LWQFTKARGSSPQSDKIPQFWQLSNKSEKNPIKMDKIRKISCNIGWATVVNQLQAIGPGMVSAPLIIAATLLPGVW
jgi:hypothetical protein